MKRDDGSGVFVFPDENDHGFSRYNLPGKAHNDYFEDQHVFGHFIQQVIQPINKGKEKPEYNKAPGSKLLPKLTSVGLYLIPLFLLFVGCYFNYRTVHAAVGRADPVSGGEVFTDVLLLTGLLGSITVVARIPRLSRAWSLTFGAFALFGAALACYALFASPHLRMAFGAGPVQALDRMSASAPLAKCWRSTIRRRRRIPPTKRGSPRSPSPASVAYSLRPRGSSRPEGRGASRRPGAGAPLPGGRCPAGALRSTGRRPWS